MKQQHIFLFLYSLLVGVVCLLVPGDLPAEQLILAALVLACLLGVWLLLTLAGRLPWLRLLLLAAAFAAALPYGGGMYPFGCVLLVLAARQLAPGASALSLSTVAVFLLGFILWPPFAAVLAMPLCVVPLFFLDSVVERLHLAHEALEDRAEENDRLRRQLLDQRKMTGAMEHAARLNERNRLAARIHDEVGHGVSGSILLLEGARLSLDRDPEKAKAALETAADNLRASVDDIRAALREERAKPGEAGLAQVAALLTRFGAQHPAIETELVTKGELAGISPQVWVCLQENLTETLTNLLKHSNANHFEVSISMQNKLVRVTFRDNGAAGDFKPGMGLSAMEERCAMCHGNCFFQGGPRGFSTIMTFTHLGEYSSAMGGAAL